MYDFGTRMNESHRKRLVRRTLLGLFVEGREELIEEAYAPAIRDTVRALVRLLRTAFPDLKMELEHLVEEGDKVACRWTATGTHRGWFHTIPPTGATARWTGMSLYGVDGDQIIAVLSNWDTFGLMRQLREAAR